MSWLSMALYGAVSVFFLLILFGLYVLFWMVKFDSYLREDDDERIWDAEIERDAKAGRLDWLVKEAEAEHAAGKTRVLRGGAE